MFTLSTNNTSLVQFFVWIIIGLSQLFALFILCLVSVSRIIRLSSRLVNTCSSSLGGSFYGIILLYSNNRTEATTRRSEWVGRSTNIKTVLWDTDPHREDQLLPVKVIKYFDEYCSCPQSNTFHDGIFGYILIIKIDHRCRITNVNIFRVIVCPPTGSIKHLSTQDWK